MSREIKFRAWDFEVKRMSNPFGIADNLITWNDGDIGMPVIFAGHKAEQRGRFHFLQYTGLKDKNGKEVYEGDLVRSKFNHYVWIYEVKSDDGFGNNLWLVTRYRNFKIEDVNDEEREIMGDFYVDEGRGYLRSLTDGRHEIIGNIYEHPDKVAKKE